MSIGFVYILLNPAFPNQIKIGRTARDPYKRAKELSQQTGVPADFIVLYDEIVADAKQVEEILHSRFIAFRVKRNKEFFLVPPKEAIKALQETASSFPIISGEPTFTVDLLAHFRKYFGKHLDPLIISIKFVQLPGFCYLEITKQSANGSPIKSEEEIPLDGIVAPDSPTLDDLRKNEALLKSCDEYDWIMISDIFPIETAHIIAKEWERPGGKLEHKRSDLFNT